MKKGNAIVMIMMECAVDMAEKWSALCIYHMEDSH